MSTFNRFRGQSRNELACFGSVSLGCKRVVSIESYNWLSARVQICKELSLSVMKRELNELDGEMSEMTRIDLTVALNGMWQR